MAAGIIHRSQDLVAVFNHLFGESYQTELVGGAKEPEYLPTTGQVKKHRILFTCDYYASALHELSHWCIAGERRRRLVDYGYWYAPDGRNALQQAAFEKVEVRPQALEWLFSAAAGAPFRVSLDNLNGSVSDGQAFTLAVRQQVRRYLETGLAQRAASFRDALLDFYNRGTEFDAFSRRMQSAA